MHSSIKSHFIQTEELKIHYLEAGEGDVILLLHGWPTSSYLWRNIMSALAKTHRVIAMDLPGFGQSDKNLDHSFSLRYNARAISGLLDGLGIEKVSLGLHDLGGPLGLYWAVQDWAKVEKLVFFNTLVYPELSWAVKLFGLASITPVVKCWLTNPQGIKRAIYFGVHDNSKLSRETIQAYQEPFTDDNAQKVLLKSIQNVSIKGLHEIAEKLPDFKGPVQIIYGENDRILPDVKQTMERVKKDLPQANVVAIPNCGHFLQEEVAEEINAVLVDFFKK